jgi:Pyruvate/2-oxoacid:ferredoxin oxidoreductase delta subunit
MKTTEGREAIRESNRRRRRCSKCSGTCELLTGLSDETHFPNLTYKRCTGCGWEEVTRQRVSKL